jgi:hypothetical protein
MRTPHAVSKGSYYRVLNQSRTKLTEGIYTLLIAIRLGVIRRGEINRLIDMTVELPEDLDSVEADRVLGVMNALIWRIVML